MVSKQKKVLKALKKKPMTLSTLAETCHISKDNVKNHINSLKQNGVYIRSNKGGKKTQYFAPDKIPNQPDKKMGIDYFGLMGDTHLGSKYAEPEALNIYYDEIAEEGIKHVFHAGDLVEGVGVYRGQVNDLEGDCVNLEGQISKAINEYPQKKDVTTHIISGNHDLKKFKKQGVDPVREVARVRDDIDFLGQNFARVRLLDDIIMELTHPTGSAPYTKGYRVQTYLRERPTTNYPDVIGMGHLHTTLFTDVQGTLAYMVGCFMGDTDYTRKKGLVATIAGWKADLKIAEGEIQRAKNEVIRF